MEYEIASYLQCDPRLPSFFMPSSSDKIPPLMIPPPHMTSHNLPKLRLSRPLCDPPHLPPSPYINMTHPNMARLRNDPCVSRSP